jgi:ribonuclease Z
MARERAILPGVHLTFLGTSAGSPARLRNVTSQALVFDDGRIWILDCGEATQHQLMRAGLRPMRIERILITHLHADHSLGLPGLLACLAIHARSESVTITGPSGVRELVETVIRLTDTQLPFALHFEELGGADDHALGLEQGWTLSAHALHHRVRCFGYCLREAPRSGRFHPDRATALGVESGPLWGELSRGHAVTQADGRVVRPEQVLSPPRPGRVVVLLGDTDDASLMVEAGRGCDVLVCEATYDAAREDKARLWGHSTTVMTGRLAQAMAAKTLIITHISSRYADDSESCGLTVQDLVRETAAQCPGTRVLAAEDIWSFPIEALEGDTAVGDMS